MRFSAVIRILALLSAHAVVLGSPITGNSLTQDGLVNELAARLTPTVLPPTKWAWFTIKPSPHAGKVFAGALVQVYWDGAVMQNSPLEYSEVVYDVELLKQSHPLMALVLENRMDQVEPILKSIEPVLTPGTVDAQIPTMDVSHHTEHPIDRMWNLLLTDLLIAATFTDAAGEKFDALRVMFHETKTELYNQIMLVVLYAAMKISNDNMEAVIRHILGQLDCTVYMTQEEEERCSDAYYRRSKYGEVTLDHLVDLGLPQTLADTIDNIASHRQDDQINQRILVPKVLAAVFSK
ncbi:hypothetical protein H4R35_001021 [Dimargaris xerosporica]|nr:hypothetical protein H4R35_001021 [Dimargaris xerosporica]